MSGRSKKTILDIAHKAGVSKSTVSLVLQGSALVKPETAVRVKKAIEDVGYVYNRGAANLRKSHSNVIGMVINDLTNPFFAELAVAMERVFQAAGIVPFIANTAENTARQEEALKTLLEQGAAGLIVSPAHGSSAESFDRIQAAGTPVLFVMRRPPKSRVPVVAPNNRQGTFLATRYLIAKGHRRIAFLGGYSDMIVWHERVGGYREALAAHRIPVDDQLVVAGETNRKGGMSAIETALALGNRPTAALCFNDAVAFGAMTGLRRRGEEPGRDFAIIGFDDVGEAQHYVPALTTIAVDTAGLGERAAHSMLNMVRAGTTNTESHIGAISLVVRDSCGPDLAPAKKSA